MPSTVDWAAVDVSVLINPPERLDDAALAVCDHIAQLTVPPLEPADETFFLQCMRTLRLLPTGEDDTLSGELRLALYRRHFGKCSRAALQHLVNKATLTCRFFPSPAECNAILLNWKRRDLSARAHAAAVSLASKERVARFDDAFARFRLGQVTQDEADAMPDHWRRIAVERGFLRSDTMAVRPLPTLDGVDP